MKTRAGPVAFTLVELLVVIAVIGVIAALLFPAVTVAKRKAQSTRCVSNLRQLGIAVRLHADDHEGRLPRARASGGTNRTEGQLPSIQEVIGPLLGKDREVFRCPADREGVFEREGSSYEWNVGLNGRILHRVGQDPTEGDAGPAFLLRDQKGWHSRGRMNVVLTDGRAGADGM